MKRLLFFICWGCCFLFATYALATDPALQVVFTEEPSDEDIATVNAAFAKNASAWSRCQVSLEEATDVGFARLAEAFPNMESLDLHCAQVTTLAPLKRLPHLHSLRIYGGQLADFSPIAACQGLKTLTIERSLAGRLHIADLSFLAGLKDLTTLELNGVEDVASLAPLGQLRALQEVNFFHVTGPQGAVLDLTPLAGLENLAVLTVMRNAFSEKDLGVLPARVDVRRY